jgi:hypothetical protein
LSFSVQAFDVTLSPAALLNPATLVVLVNCCSCHAPNRQEAPMVPVVGSVSNPQSISERLSQCASIQGLSVVVVVGCCGGGGGVVVWWYYAPA